jgi:hypothetical protein
MPAIQIFVRDTLGEGFIFPPAFNLAEIYKDSSPGSNSFASLLALINALTIHGISLGQGWATGVEDDHGGRSLAAHGWCSRTATWM